MANYPMSIPRLWMAAGYIKEYIPTRNFLDSFNSLTRNPACLSQA
jgi:hypothetical protein